jgi:arsenical resistance operon trans-acting repressor ArsD
MMEVTVVRRIPRPIVGSFGIVHDRAFEEFEERLDWLEALGVRVERLDPSASSPNATGREELRALLSPEGERCLPLVLVNGTVFSRGVHPSRTDLARAVGRGRPRFRRAVARRLAAIGAAAALGSEREADRCTSRAKALGVPEGQIRAARRVGARLGRAARMVPVG